MRWGLDDLLVCVLVSSLFANAAAAKPQATERGESGSSPAVIEAPEPEESPAPPLPEKTLEDVAGAVVLLERLDADGRHIGTASGFIVKPGLVITNRHCIEGASALKLNLGERGVFDVKGLVAESEHLDVVFLKADFPEPSPAMLEWAPAMPRARTAVSVVVRDPKGRVTTSPGWTRLPDFDSISGALVLESSAPAWMGCSGTPMVDHEGRVIGVVSRLGSVMPGQARATGQVAICDDVRAIRIGELIPINRVPGIAGTNQVVRRLLRKAEGVQPHFPDEAERYFLRAGAADPDDGEAVMRYAQFLLAQHRDEHAQQLLTKFIKAHPSNIECRLSLGHLAFGSGKWDDAVKAYEDALSINSDCGMTWFWKGMAHWYAKDLAKAAGSLERVIKCEPRHVASLRLLSSLYHNEGRVDDWRRVVRLWCAQRPSDEEPFEQLVAATSGPDHGAEREEALRRLRGFSPFAANRSEWQPALWSEGLSE